MLLCVRCDGAVDPAMWNEALDALDAVSPLIDDVRPGLAFVEMRGIAGDPATWMAQTRAVLRPFQLAFRLSVASNQFVARAAANVADGTVCAAGKERAFVAPLSLDLLELEPDVAERLRLLGIDRLGELAALPHGPFVRRFGPQSARWHEWACGNDKTPFVPRGHAVAIEAAVFGEGRAEDEAQVFFALRVLLARICSDLERCGKRAGSLRLDIELDDASTQNFEVLLASPTARERAMLDVIRAKLEGVTFSSPIVGLRLRAGRLEEGGEAMPLFATGDFDPEAIAVAIARLEAMLGEPVRQAKTQNAHVLEERFCYEPFQPPKRDAGHEKSQLKTEIVPQLRLLSVSEVDVAVRGGEPATVDARSVLECAGPWRVEIGWFSGAIARDEYDVLLDDGEAYRIYRQGNHWYVRGAYD